MRRDAWWSPRVAFAAWIIVLVVLVGFAIMPGVEPEQIAVGPRDGSPEASAVAATVAAGATDQPTAPGSPDPRRGAGPGSREARPTLDGNVVRGPVAIREPATGALARSSGHLHVGAVSRLPAGRRVDVVVRANGRPIGEARMATQDGGTIDGYLRVDLPSRPTPVRLSVERPRDGRPLGAIPFILQRGPLTFAEPYRPDLRLEGGSLPVIGRAYEGIGDVVVRLEDRTGRVRARAVARTFTDLTSPPTAVVFTTRVRLPRRLPAGTLWLVATRDADPVPVEARTPVRPPAGDR